MESLKRSTRNEWFTEEQRNSAWDRDDWPGWERNDWPTWERVERPKHTILRNLTPKMPAFAQDPRACSLQEQIDRDIQEHRYEDIPTLEDALITEQNDLQQQWDLTVKERRWSDAARFRDALAQHERPQQLPDQMPQHIQKQTMETEVTDKRCTGESPALHIIHGPTLTISGS